VSRRARAIGFGCAALVCAGLAATLAGGYRGDIQSELGPLRRAVVARSAVPARTRLGPADARRLLEVRRIPSRFVPAGTLTAPEQAVGRAPAGRIPSGAYVLAGQLRDPGPAKQTDGARLRDGREPVQIAVTGAEALAATGRDPEGTRVDVIVTTEPGPGGGSGRTRLAASAVELLSLTQSADGGGADLPGPGGGSWDATLAVTHSEAIRLIQAENFARQVRLIPH
jgi:Flp pilus assembly protein CpaB